jgi:hypothetical protein
MLGNADACTRDSVSNPFHCLSPQDLWLKSDKAACCPSLLAVFRLWSTCHSRVLCLLHLPHCVQGLDCDIGYKGYPTAVCNLDGSWTFDVASDGRACAPVRIRHMHCYTSMFGCSKKQVAVQMWLSCHVMSWRKHYRCGIRDELLAPCCCCAGWVPSYPDHRHPRSYIYCICRRSTIVPLFPFHWLSINAGEVLTAHVSSACWVPMWEGWGLPDQLCKGGDREGELSP